MITRTSHTLGLAAGLDKNATKYKQILDNSIFDYVEIGTITEFPNEGHKDKFTEVHGRTIYNYNGLNNDGADEVLKRLDLDYKNRIGVNIYGDEESMNRLMVMFEPYCSYITINISCPNISKEYTEISKLKLKGDVFAKLSAFHVRPKLLKSIIDAGFKGVIIGNSVMHPRHGVICGKSGESLLHKNEIAIFRIPAEIKSQLIIIGLGGIMNNNDVATYASWGCKNVQVFTQYYLKVHNKFE